MPRNLRGRFPFQRVCHRDPGCDRLVQGETEQLQYRDKGIVRWLKDASAKLVKSTVYTPEGDFTTESGSEFSEGKKKGFISKVRKIIGRFAAHRCQQKQCKTFNKKMERSYGISALRNRKVSRFPVKCDGFLRMSRMTDSPQEFLAEEAPNCLQNNRSYSFRTRGNSPPTTQVKQLANKIFATFKAKLQKTARIQVDVDVVEDETASLIGNNLIVRSRRMSRRVSVTSLSTDQQKVVDASKRQHLKIFKKKKKNDAVQKRRHSFLTVEKLQAQVNDLIETVSEKSMQLLAQRHAELQQCEYLGDEILQSSKQFQRVSRKSARKYKWKKCLMCGCCC
ncbi:putative uncharacterized protein C3orf49 homolog [Amblyraja radiata]|uniref:putative uncharacterized protein C3orf49 homolog n=1 Tax=Amblyraja radiata TaxID=386614 RepID=UPI0014034F5D|nr:putative uncharacterized protein C3orf49 homolog [Amblyraja radiata]